MHFVSPLRCLRNRVSSTASATVSDLRVTESNEAKALKRYTDKKKKCAAKAALIEQRDRFSKVLLEVDQSATAEGGVSQSAMQRIHHVLFLEKKEGNKRHTIRRGLHGIGFVNKPSLADVQRASAQVPSSHSFFSLADMTCTR